MSAQKTYLGDGTYADIDWDSVVLTTENGVGTQNEIFLDGSMMRRLIDWYKKLTGETK